MKRIIKKLSILILIIAALAVVVIIFISPIAKYLIEKNDEKLTGRNISLKWVYINPFTGYVYFDKLKIFEKSSDSIFFSADGFSANIALIKLFTGTYEISACKLTHPYGAIYQNKKIFNFSDLVEKFTPKEKRDKSNGPVHLNVLGMKITDGVLYYHEKLTPVDYFIKNINIESDGFRWNADTIQAKVAFLSGIGTGAIKGQITINLKNLDYRLAAFVEEFDLQIIGQYLKELTNYGYFSAFLEADVKATGNFREQENINASGMVAINKFHFGINSKEDFASFKRLSLKFDEVNPKNHKYLFDSISLNYPYFKFEKYDYLDNLQTMFGKGGANIKTVNAQPEKFNLVIEIARYVKVLAKNFFKSAYKIDNLEVKNGDFRFNDYATIEKFSVALQPLNIIADSIDKGNRRVFVVLDSEIKPYGHAKINLSINPKDSADFEIKYQLSKIPVTVFNPYIISFTSFPLDRGTIELRGEWKVNGGKIQSENHLVIIDPRVTKRLRKRDAKWLPVPLIMSFVRERGNVMDYEIPITGDLNDPKFHFRDVLLDVLKNIFVKPATTPYRLQVKNIESKIEKSISLKWDMRSSKLHPKQVKFIQRMTEFLKDNPEAVIAVYPQNYTVKEKEYILFYETKKKFEMASGVKDNIPLTSEKIEKIDKMSVKDSLFVQYLNIHDKKDNLFTIQDKCSQIVLPEYVNAQFGRLNRDRMEVFKAAFKEKNVLGQVQIYPGENVIPFNGFSFYRIEYKGKFPDDLIKAYRQISDLNDEAPRKKYKNDRKRSKVAE